MPYNSEQAGSEGGHEILPGPRRDDGVVRPGDGWAVICRHHQTHLKELASVDWQSVGGGGGGRGEVTTSNSTSQEEHNVQISAP